MRDINSESRNFKGIWIPREIWLCKNLSIGEKVLIAEISSLEDEEKGFFASNEYLSSFFGLSTKRVREVIAVLVKKGFIKTNCIDPQNPPKQRILRVVENWKNTKRGRRKTS